MSLLRIIKRIVAGPPGLRPRLINRGLLKGVRVNIDTSFRATRLLGLEETEIAGYTAEMASRAVSALDVGANDGWYSMYFASRPNIRTVVSFEPEQYLRDELAANLALNPPEMAQKITVVPKFCGNSNDEKTCSIDVAFPDLPMPAVIKVDVDGGEMEVFRGAVQTLKKPGCMVVLETHSAQLDKDCREFLESLNYQVRPVNPGWYRKFLPKGRSLEFNRWIIASQRGS